LSSAARLALFDLDGTLLDGDTDELWCDFLLAEGVLDRPGFEARNRSVAQPWSKATATPPTGCC
jgi:phosphoserine phosphatase